MYGPGGPSVFELAVQCLSSVERGYDLLAEKFDRTPFRTPDEVVEAMLEYGLREHPVVDALDLCCGTGAVLSRLRPRVTGRLVGIDLSAGMLCQARERLRGVERGDAVELVHGDVCALAYEQSFDAVTCAGAFGHFLPEQLDALVAGVFRALRPGGRFVAVTSVAPEVLSARWWALHGFDAAMRARNVVWSPPFVMYYATFLWPEARGVLERAGFRVKCIDGVFAEGGEGLVVVSGTRP